jgi:hypothetical protein
VRFPFVEIVSIRGLSALFTPGVCRRARALELYAFDDKAPLGQKPAAATQFTGMETFYKKNRGGLSIQFPKQRLQRAQLILSDDDLPG